MIRDFNQPIRIIEFPSSWKFLFRIGSRVGSANWLRNKYLWNAKIKNSLPISFWEHRGTNPGQLSWKRQRYLCALTSQLKTDHFFQMLFFSNIWNLRWLADQKFRKNWKFEVSIDLISQVVSKYSNFNPTEPNNRSTFKLPKVSSRDLTAFQNMKQDFLHTI